MSLHSSLYSAQNKRKIGSVYKKCWGWCSSSRVHRFQRFLEAGRLWSRWKYAFLADDALLLPRILGCDCSFRWFFGERVPLLQLMSCISCWWCPVLLARDALLLLLKFQEQIFLVLPLPCGELISLANGLPLLLLILRYVSSSLWCLWKNILLADIPLHLGNFDGGALPRFQGKRNLVTNCVRVCECSFTLLMWQLMSPIIGYRFQLFSDTSYITDIRYSYITDEFA